MFEDRGRLGDRGVVVLGPSTAYSRYVANFLPRLGFRKVTVQTYDEFISEAIRAANPEMEILPASDSRAAVRDKNSRAIDRVLIESIWPKSAVPEAAVRVRTDNRKAAEIRRFGREIQEIHDGLRELFERFEISYEDARQRFYSGIVALFRAQNEENESKLRRRPDEKVRDDIREFIFTHLRETDLAMFLDFQEQIEKSPLLDNDLLVLAQAFDKEDIKNAVEVLTAEVLEWRRSSSTTRDEQRNRTILSVASIRQRLEEDEVPLRTDTAPAQRQFGSRNRVDLGEFRPIDMTADKDKGLGRAVWQYVTKVMPNRDFTRIASETWTGRNRVFTELKVKQIAALGSRLKTYASDRDRNTRAALHASSTDLALSAICSSLIHGSRSRHAHVFMDEAQDLTLIQVRALRILVGTAPLTVTGDLNQSTTFGSINSWETLLENLGRHAVAPNDLNVNYRVPESIYRYATKYLDDDESLAATRCELDGGELEIIETPRKSDSLSRASEIVVSFDDAGLIGVVGDPADLREMTLEASPNILVTSPTEAKGLEVDHLIVVEPSTWYDETPETRRAMFVVLTRSTKTVTIVQSNRAFGRIIPQQ
jgi:DNA helicase IV